MKRSATVLDRVVFSCLLGLIVLTIIPYGTVDQWWEAVFECAVFAISAIWILEVLLKGSWEVRRLGVLLPLLLITVYAFAQTFQLPGFLAKGSALLAAQHTLTIDRYQTYLTATKTLALTLFLGLLLLHTSNPGRLRWLVRVIVAVGLASALFGILRQLLQSPDSTTGFVLPFLFPEMGYGQFISTNVFAYLMEMVFALLAGLILGGGVPRNRILIQLAIAIVVWAALVLSNSRGAILSLTFQSILLLFVALNWYSARRLSLEDGKQPKWLTFLRTSVAVRVVFVIVIVVTLVAGVLWMGGEKLASKLQKENSAQATIDGTTRQEIWRSSWKLIKHYPLTGVGFGAYFLKIPEYQIGSGRIKVEEAHNDYLELAASGGLIAVGLAGWFIAMIIWRARFSFRSSDSYRRATSLGASAAILSVCVHSLVDFGLQVTGIAVVFAGLVVVLVADNRVESVGTTKKQMTA